MSCEPGRHAPRLLGRPQWGAVEPAISPFPKGLMEPPEGLLAKLMCRRGSEKR